MAEPTTCRHYPDGDMYARAAASYAPGGCVGPDVRALIEAGRDRPPAGAHRRRDARE